MIGLVIVSHSRALAEALRNLAQQVSTIPAPVAIAAGAGPDKSEFGTDALEIMDAIQSVYSPDGVLILMDLGSAILSAQMAVELLPEEMQGNVKFCSAPVVEGAIAAVVQAGLGSDLDTACQEAQQALLPKQQQLGEDTAPAPPPAPVTVTAPGGTEVVAVLKLGNQHGLHARPAARFVQLAGKFDAVIQVTNLTNGRGPISAKSLNALATLGAVYDHEIEIRASGAQASEALSALSRLVADNFGEPAAGEPASVLPEPVIKTEPAVIDGAQPVIPIAEGVAFAPLYKYSAPPPPIPDTPALSFAVEWARLESALAEVKNSIQNRRDQVAASAGEEQAGIFDAHILILEDPDLLELCKNSIAHDGLNAAAAWSKAIQHTIQLYRQLSDPYLQQRAADVADVGNQVLYALAGSSPAATIHLAEPVILLAEELTPTQTAQLDLDKVLGIATILGGPTSHSAILARSLGIPAVSGAPAAMLRLENGTPIGLDGSRGALWIDPQESDRQELEQRRSAWLETRQKLLAGSSQPAATRDGHRVEVVANIGGLPDALAAVKNGAEGVGLLRTEFLFLTRTDAPGEEEQFAALEPIARTFAENPVIVRTLDVGGDKPLPYISMPAEANPFLGVRAVRLSLSRPDLFRDQLKAILRAGAAGNFKIMFPMVSGIDEVDQIKGYLEAAHAELSRKSIPHQWPVETGIMVEIPSVAVMADVLAPRVDFFSIGTNDLTQYTLAAERGNPSLANLADAMHPAVLRLISQVAAAAHAHGKWVGVCGELAGDPEAVAVLVGLGVDELSLNSAGIPRVKAILRTVTLADAQSLAAAILKAPNTSAVRRLAGDFLAALPID